MAQAQKTYGRKTLLINSAYRVNPNGTPTSNFIYRFKEKIENVVHINLRQAVIENGVYNIVGGTTNNNTLYLNQNVSTASPTQSTITIPPGYYDDATLTLLLGLLFNGANIMTSISGSTPSTFFISIDSMGFVNIINDTATDWNITFPASSTLWKTLGFNGATKPSGKPLAPFVGYGTGPYLLRADNAIKLTNYDSILIQSDRLGNDIASAQGFNAFWSLLNGNQLSNSTTITYENPRPPQLDVPFRSPRDIEWIDVRLIDNTGQELNLAGNDVHLLLEFFTDDSARK